MSVETVRVVTAIVVSVNVASVSVVSVRVVTVSMMIVSLASVSEATVSVVSAVSVSLVTLRTRAACHSYILYLCCVLERRARHRPLDGMWQASITPKVLLAGTRALFWNCVLKLLISAAY